MIVAMAYFEGYVVRGSYELKHASCSYGFSIV